LQQRLSLAPAAAEIELLAIVSNLRDVAPERPPAADLSLIFVFEPASQEITAIPLEPAPRIVRVDPALAPPFRQRLAGLHPEIV
jgi:hypothetical protein